MPNKHVFMTITNEDLYYELKGVRQDIANLKRDNKNTKWIAGVALTISLMSIGALISL